MQELLDNFDDIDGPGNNSYLYYDPESGRSPWWPGTTTWPSGGWAAAEVTRAGPGWYCRRPVLRASAVICPRAQEPPDGMQPAEGFRPQQGVQAPEGMELPDGLQAPGGGAGGPRMSRSNILVERFKANPEWEQLV